MKKIISLLCAVLCVLSLTACNISGTEPISEEDQASMEQTAQIIISQCLSMDDATFDQMQEIRDTELDYMLLSAGYPISGENFKKVLSAWQSGIEEAGELDASSLGEFSFKSKSDEIIASVDASFSERDATMEFTFDTDGTLTSLTIGAKYSTGEILKKAGLNTLIGMGTCFAVLIFIALIISLFGFFGKTKKADGQNGVQKDVPAKKDAPVKKDNAEEKAVISAAIAAYEDGADSAKDNTELIAVISAAVAAFSGGSAGTIRSITRSADGGNVYRAGQNFDHVEGFAARSSRRHGKRS